MSIESLAIAMNHSRSKGTAKLVLIGIASHDGDGGAFPKVATLAKYANVSPRRVPEALRTLGELGEIIVHTSRGGTFRTAPTMKPNLYEFILECPEDCDRTKNHRVKGEKLGRSYKGTYDPDHVKDPGYVARAKAARARTLGGEPVDKVVDNPVDNVPLPLVLEIAPSAAGSTTPSAAGSTTKNHQLEPPFESSVEVPTSPVIPTGSKEPEWHECKGCGNWRQELTASRLCRDCIPGGAVTPDYSSARAEVRRMLDESRGKGRTA